MQRTDGGLRTTNARHRLDVRFGAAGVDISAQRQRLGLTLGRFGYAGALRAVPAVAPSASANRVSYRRPGLVEWYANGPLGLEQGFTLARPPAGQRSGPLTLSLDLSGPLGQTARRDRTGVSFGTLTYRGLVATDAAGRRLPARLVLGEHALSIRVDDRGARYPLVVDPLIQFTGKLTASDGADSDLFGYSIAIDGDTIAVGAVNNDTSRGPKQGAVYVFTKPPGGWADATQTGKLTAADGADDDGLGYSVSVSGDTIVAGNMSKGVVYVFAEPGGGWTNGTETATLTASDAFAGNSLGSSVATDGATIAAGALGAGVGGATTGAVYVYARPGGGWTNATETAKLTASDGSAGDYLGWSVAIDGGTVATGAVAATIGGHDAQGAVYVFSEPGGGWVDSTQTAKLTASDGTANDQLGISVSVDGGTIVAGAPYSPLGSAYIFAEPGAGWTDGTESAEFVASDGAAADALGFGVAVAGPTFAASAHRATVGGHPTQGAVYIESGIAIPPDTAIGSHPSQPTTATDAAFTFSATVPATFECRLDGAPFTPCTSPTNYTGLTEGPHTFRVRAVDTAGTPDPAPATFTWAVDGSVPDTSIVTHPSDPSSQSSPAFTFGATEPATFECSLDSGPFTACASPTNLAGLAEGLHRLDVRAIDTVGNTDATPASFTWHIDTIAPDTSIGTTPTNPSAVNTATFTFDASETASFECALDGGAFSACTSPAAYASLADGLHIFQVRATDAAGNTDPTPASFAWSVDGTAPDTSIDSHPADPSTQTAATFTFSSNGVATFECALDAGAFAACSSPAAFTGLADGSHIFQVRATDTAGNVDATPASFTWSIDTTAPDTTIGSHPNNPSAQTSPSFNFNATETGTFQCKLDSGAFAVCSRPKSYSGLGQGAHTFQVRAVDSVGNVDPSPASFTWTIDTVAPDTSIDTHPPDPSAQTTGTFGFSATEAATFRCTLDGGASIACTSPTAFTGLADGSHTVQVRATDLAGNIDSSAASYTWTVDATTPDTSLGAHPTNPSKLTTASFTFSATTAATFECRLDGGPFAACTSPRAYTALARRSHMFEVRATDAAGNVDATPASFTWTNGSVPKASITTRPSANDPAPGIGFTSNDAGARYECALDAGAFTPCSSPKSYTGLADGPHTFRVRAINGADAAGKPLALKWTVDTTPPDTSITVHPAAATTSTGAGFSLASSDKKVTYLCRLDASPFAACKSKMSYAGLAHTSHTFEARARDGAGNIDPTPASFTWTIS